MREGLTGGRGHSPEGLTGAGGRAPEGSPIVPGASPPRASWPRTDAVHVRLGEVPQIWQCQELGTVRFLAVTVLVSVMYLALSPIWQERFFPRAWALSSTSAQVSATLQRTVAAASTFVLERLGAHRAGAPRSAPRKKSDV